MASTSSTGLTDEQVAKLQDELAAGRAPRVKIEGSQFAAGTAGIVKRVGDPAVDGEDFITVRVKINGVTDELLFGPKELSRGKRKQAPPPATRRTATRKPSVATPPPATPAKKKPASKTPAKTTSRRAASSAPVVITISSVDTSWTVNAQRGSRSVLKNASVNPGAVAAIAALLDQPALDEAVAAVNDTGRLEAESRAEHLRAELAQIQAVLDSHRRP
jgi:hypothetical protein